MKTVQPYKTPEQFKKKLQDEYLSARVKAGCLWMDKMLPGWEDKINLDELDLQSPHKCVLGQTLGFWPSEMNDPENQLGLFGFDVTPRGARLFTKGEGFEQGDVLCYKALTKAWKREILLRKN